MPGLFDEFENKSTTIKTGGLFDEFATEPITPTIPATPTAKPTTGPLSGLGLKSEFLQPKRFEDPTLSDKPFLAGAFTSYIPGIKSLPLDKTGITREEMIAKSPKAYKAGEVVGTIGKFASAYGSLGGLVGKAAAPLGKAIGTSLAPALPEFAIGAGKLAPTVTRAAAAVAPTLAIEGIKDLVIGTPLDLEEGLSAGLKGKELANFMGEQAVYNLIGNGIMLGGESLLKSRALRKATAGQIDEIAEATAKQTTLPKEVIKENIDDIVKQAEVPEAGPLLKAPEVVEGLPVKPLAGAVPEVQPIDTLTKVLTETPPRVKPNIADKAERAYQEIFSTNIPFEKVGGRVRTQGSNLNRIQGTVEYNAVGKQVDMQGNEIGKSIVDIFADVPKDSKKGLFDYTLNTHNIDRFREGKPVFGETVSDLTSAQKVADYDISNPEFKAKQQEITNYFRNLQNEWGVKSGLVSQETADMLAERYPNYIPTYRARDLPKSMIQGNQNIAQIIKRAKGSEKFILPIDQQMIALTDRTVKNARKNELINTIANAFEAGDSNANRYIKEIKGLPKEAVDDLIDVGKNFDEVPVLKGDEYAVNFYTNGEPRQMVVNKTLYKALENTVSDAGINKVAQATKKYLTNPFKSLITGYNPLFGASNIMRDVPTALTYSTNPLKMSENVPRAIKEMTTNGKLYRQFKAMGGTREGLIGSGKEFKVPNLGESKKAFSAAQKANPVKVIGDINNFTETLPRFSEYLTILDKTGDPALAVYGSAELTTDFSRHGNLTKLIDNFVPYLNPSVQGIDRFFRGFRDTPLKTIAKGATAITVPTVILDQINKDNEDYNNLSPRERNLYFNVPIPDSDKFLRIPKSRELGVAFSSIYEWAARKSRGQEVTGKEIAQAIGENFTPTDITAPILTPALKAWEQIKNPEAYETNYWGGLIVPTKLRKYSPGEQYDLNSSGIAKAIGKEFEISPYVVDYLIKSYSGIIGQIAQPIGAERKTTPLTPLARKFINDPVFKSDSVNRFYELLDKSKKEAQDFNKQKNIPSKVVTPLERKASALNKLSLQMSKIRAEQKRLQTQKGNEDRIRELQIQINKTAERGLK